MKSLLIAALSVTLCFCQQPIDFGSVHYTDLVIQKDADSSAMEPMYEVPPYRDGCTIAVHTDAFDQCFMSAYDLDHPSQGWTGVYLSFINIAIPRMSVESAAWVNFTWQELIDSIRPK